MKRERSALLLNLALCVAPALFSAAAVRAEGGSGTPEDLEQAGDRHWTAALPFYRASVEAWERAIPRDRDPGSRERSGLERAGLALLLRDSRLLDVLRTGPSATLAGGAAVPGPILLVGDAAEPPVEALDRLLRFLESGQRRFARQPGHSDRDEALLFEASAWAQRLRGEFHQRAADSEYAKALLALEPASSEPRNAFRRGRLLFKLRSLAAARGALQAAISTGQGLSKEEDLEALARLRDIALADGDLAAARRLGDEIRKRSSTAEEPARPVARFQSLIAGASVDLAETAQTIHSLLQRHRLSARPRSVLGFLLAEAAIELGENALAEEVLKGLSGGGDPWLEAAISSRRGLVRTLLGDFEAGTIDLEKASALTAGLSGVADFSGRVGINLARAYLGLGELDRARTQAIAVAGARDLGAELRIRARILTADALYEQSRETPAALGDAEAAYQTAERDLNAAKLKDKSLESAQELEAILAINLGNVGRRKAQALTGEAAVSRRKEALALQDRALRSAEAGKLWPLAAVASANLGELHLEAGNAGEAEGFVSWALARAVEHRLFETEWRCHWYMGRIAEAKGQHAEADSAYLRAASVIESYRSRILDAESKAGFLTDKMDFYRDCVRREVDRGRPDLALAACERAKARALVDSLGWRFVALADPRESSLYREYVSLLCRSERAREGRGSRIFGLEASGASFEDLRGRLQALRGQLTGNREVGPALRALIDGDPADVSQILAEIPRGATLVEYFGLQDGMVAIVAADGALQAVRLKATVREVNSLIAQFLRTNAEDAALARRLYTMLFESIEPRIRGDSVVVVPFGSLHQLPFETLRDDRGFLVGRFSFSYLPSASVIRHLRRKAMAPGGARLLAVVDPDTDYNRDGKPDMPPLPRARDEVAGFAPSFTSRTVLEGARAIKLECQRDAGTFDVIHYACHGEFYPARPWDSTLFLSPGVVDGVRDDGRLRASEIYSFDLRRSRLVALSGCETGRSQVSPGDDAVSIGAAFLHAGAPALLVSLWKVEDDATAELMKSFYDKWIRGGVEKGRALRETKLELLARGYSHPRQWGAFVLLGDS